MLQANPYGRCNPAFDAAAAHHPLFRPGKPEFVSLKTCGRTERKKYDPEKDKTDDAGIVIAILLGVFIVVYFGHLYLEEEEELKKYRR